MTGDMPRPSTRLSSREPTPKRRRAPPPLSVTNVFSDARLPDSAEKLWKWPVTSWYFGDVGNADLHITSDRPFINDVTSLPPIEKHYRLRWLEEDANKFVNGEQPTPPEPLPLIPYGRQKDTTACARPARGLGTGVERGAPGRPRKRRCIPTEAPVVEPATISDERQSANNDPVTNAPQSRLKASDAFAEIPSPTRVASLANAVKPEPMSIDIKPRNVSYRQPKIPPASNFCTPPLSVQEALAAPTTCETFPCEASLENEFSPSESPESAQPANEETKESAHSNENGIHDEALKSHDDENDEDSREAVALQFVSPVEPRLMGTLTYSFPVDAAPEKDDRQVSVVDTPPEVKQNTFAEEGICLEGMDLEFRKSNRPFDDVCEDRDVVDELRPEIMRLNNLLNGLGPKTKPLRNMIHAVIKKEMIRHNEALEAETEEARIIARLKEIEKDKAAAKAKEKAAEAKEKAAARRASGRLVTQGRPRRRTSRKIVDEPQSDHDSDNEDNMKDVGEAVVPLDDNRPILDGKVVDYRKLLLKPEYKAELEELTSVILNAPQAAMTADSTQRAEIQVQQALCQEKPVTAVNAPLPNLKNEINEAKVDDVPSASPSAANSVPPVPDVTPSREEPGDAVLVVAPKDSRTVKFPIVDAPAFASATATGESVELTEANPVKERSPAGVEPVEMTSRSTEDTMRHVLVELTNIPSKFQPQEAERQLMNDLVGAACEESELNPIWYDVADNSGRFQNERMHLGQEPEAEVTTTPITEIDMDAAPDSDDEAKPKEIPIRGACELQVDLKAPCEYDSDSQFILQSAEGNAPCTIFVKDGKIDEQLIRMPSPVSPLQAATPTCGFVVVPTSSRTKLLTSGSALVNHMKAIHDEAKKKIPSESDS